MTKRIIAIIAAISVAVACAASEPEPSRSRYLETTGAGFAMSPEDGVRYALTFAVREEVSQAVHVLFLFENPEKGGAPLEKMVVLEPGAKELVIQSEPLKAIRNNKTYLVQLFLYADATKSKPVGIHEQQVLFAVPRQYLKQIEKDYAIAIK